MSASLREMIDEMELDLMGKRARLVIVRDLAAKGRWPQHDIDGKVKRIAVFEQVDRVLREFQKREAA